MVGLGQQMYSARSTLLRRCLQTSCPAAAFRLLRKLGFDFRHCCKESGQGVLHWTAAAGDADALRLLLRLVTPCQDIEGKWPWDVAAPAVVEMFKHVRHTKRGKASLQTPGGSACASTGMSTTEFALASSSA